MAATDSDGGHNVTISSSLGSCGPGAGGTSCDIALADGSYDITYSATCPSGSTAVSTTHWDQDSVPPTVGYSLSPTLPATGWYLSGPVIMTCSGSDGGSGFAGIVYGPGGQTASGDGSFARSCTASDVAGNTATTGTTINIDGTNPIPSLLCNGSVCGAGWYTANVTLTAGASDATSGVASSAVSVDGGGWVSSATLGEGTHSVSSRAVDNAGNSASTSGTVRVDTTLPSATITCNGVACASSWYSGAVAVSLSASDSTSGVTPGSAEVSINGGPWMASTVLTVDGTYSVDGRVRDNAGNTTSVSWVVQVDSTAPVITATLSGGVMGGGGIYLSGPVTLTCTAVDPTSGLSTITYGTMVATAGLTTLDCTATDNAGNISFYSTPVTIDSVLPNGSFAFIGDYCNGGWYNSPVYVNLVASDNLGGIVTSLFYVDGKAWDSTRAVMDGIHSITGSVYDQAGNRRSLSETLQVDTYPPMSSFITEADTWVGGSVSLEGQSIDWTSGIALVEISLDGGKTWIAVGKRSNWSYEWDTLNPKIKDGEYTLMARAKDNACNQEHTGYLTINVDNTPPELSLQDSLVVFGNSTAYIANDSGSGVDKARVTISGNGIEPRVLEFSTSGGKQGLEWDGRDGKGEVAPFGVYNVVVEVWDKVGNYSSTKGTWVRPLPEAPAPIVAAENSNPDSGASAAPEIKSETGAESGLPRALPFWSIVLPLGALGVWLAASNVALARDRRWIELRGIRQTVARYRDQNKINFPQEGEE